MILQISYGGFFSICFGNLGWELSLKEGATFSRHGGGGLAFFSSGHFKKLQDFDPRHRDDDGEGRRDPFVGIDLEMLQQVLVLDRVPWIEKTGRSSCSMMVSFLLHCWNHSKGVKPRHV